MTSISTRLDIRKVTGRIGAEITGVDLSRELDAETGTAIRAALNEHKALVFTDVQLDDDGQQRFARHFGELTAAHPTVAAVDGAPNVLPVDDNYDDLPRLLHRVTVAGDVPVGVDGERSYSIEGDATHYTNVATTAGV